MRKKGKHKKPAYAAMIETVDQSMEHSWLLKELDWKDTIIVFTRINGGAVGDIHYPFKGNKGKISLKGGIRVPLIVKIFPGKVNTRRWKFTFRYKSRFISTILGLAKLTINPFTT